MENFHTTFSLWNNILTSIGLNSVQQYNLKGQNFYKRSILKFLYCLFILIFWMATTTLFLKNNSSNNMKKGEVDFITLLFIFFIMFSELLISFLLVIIYMMNSKKYMDIFATYNIDLLNHHDYKKLKKYFASHTFGALISLSCFYMYNVWSIETTNPSLNEFHRCAFTLIWFISPIYNFTISCHFFTMSKWLQMHFKKINMKLEGMRLGDKNPNHRIYLPQFKFDEKQLWVSPEFKRIKALKNEQSVSIS